MKYKYGSRRRALEYEKALIDYWKKDKTFEKSIEQRPASNSYVFYDGPPFITGNPHHGTLLSSIVKDCIPRYQTMQGKRVERRWGWDCHGLPAENFTEKHLGGTVSRVAGSDRLQLKVGETATEITLENYINTAKDLMVANSATWESTIDRIGRWVDFHGAYKTMDRDFMESVWWAFKQLYEKGKIYEGEKVLMYDTKFATPVSKNEVTMDNDAYRTVTDPSVYVKFNIGNDNPDVFEALGLASAIYDGEDYEVPSVYLLAWTTTPWTLSANMALAVNPASIYVVAKYDNEYIIIAKNRLDQVFVDVRQVVNQYEVVSEITGDKLVGLGYQPILGVKEILDSQKGNYMKGKDYEDTTLSLSDSPITFWYKSWQVYAADFVGESDGTGIVHIAPAYGENDFDLAKQNSIPVVHVIDDNGYYLPEIADKLRALGVRDTDERGIEVWAANKFIAKCLHEAGTVWKIDHIQHEYPFNPRSGQRIMYRAIPSWFFDIQESKPLMLEQNENINWFPEYLKHGRFAKNIDQAPDWNLSRDRFWATAMPVWKGDKGTIKVIGSYQELKELSGVELEDYHRPWVDRVTFDVDGEHFQRVDKVLDCWFESGSMPFAQLHYPFENKDKFEANYPADFIVEYVGQVRAWFYYVHTVNTALFGQNAFKNVITTGVVAGNDGRKMSKSLGNFTDPNELMDKFSADSLRFLLLSSPLLSGEDFALIDKDVSDTARKLTMIWNMYDFFTMYAEVDNWEFTGDLQDPSADLQNPLDIWIISRIHQLAETIEKFMDAYNIPDAMAEILPFIDDASNWFVRRSRRRFWKSEDDIDKNHAYQTLHYVLSYLSLILAPFTPFLAEELWQQMVGEGSVHLRDWPAPGVIGQEVLNDMQRTRDIITEGLALRMRKSETENQIKVRQPLARLAYAGAKLDDFYEQIIAEEVNVKTIEHLKDNSKTEGEIDEQSWVELDKTLTPELRQEGFTRELIRFIQSARKKAGLNVDDRIRLSITGPLDLPEDLTNLIKSETLALELTTSNYAYDEIITIDNQQFTISLEKA